MSLLDRMAADRQRELRDATLTAVEARELVRSLPADVKARVIASGQKLEELAKADLEAFTVAFAYFGAVLQLTQIREDLGMPTDTVADDYRP